MITKEEMAALLNGREYAHEITKAECQQAKDSGLVVIFGYSDDNVELRGAIHDEVGAWEGTTLCLHQGGVLESPEQTECERCQRMLKRAQKECINIEVEWGGFDYSWFINGPLTIPFAPFDIMECGKKFCRGIVLSITDLPKLMVSYSL